MKKILLLAFLSLTCLSMKMYGQAVTADPALFSPEDSVEFIIDVKLCTNQGLIDHDPEDVYLWTWMPTGGAGRGDWSNSPGGGSDAWPASNPNLKAKYKGNNVWSFKMIPTVFYNTSADECYDKDFKMLLKSGDGTKQTEDLELKIDAPVTGPKKTYMFPGRPTNLIPAIKLDDVVTLFYDRNLETKPLLISNAEFSVFAEAVMDDSVTKVRVCTLKQVGDRPELKMKDKGNGLFSFTFIPNDLFGTLVPMGKEIRYMQFKIVKTVPGNIAPSLDETVEDPAQFTSGYFLFGYLID